MKSIAITGTIGSGKSACSQILREAGFQVFDCDAACHAYLSVGGLLYQPVIELLGPDVICEDGQIDRKKVAGLIFSDPALKKKYEQMFHVELKSQLKHLIETHDLFFAEVPLLFETGFDELFDEIWLVFCDEKTAIERCQKNRNMSEEEVRARIRTQMSVELKKEKSDVLLNNSKTLQDLHVQIHQAVKELVEHGTARKAPVSN